jgi:hypothetical protein
VHVRVLPVTVDEKGVIIPRSVPLHEVLTQLNQGIIGHRASHGVAGIHTDRRMVIADRVIFVPDFPGRFKQSFEVVNVVSPEAVISHVAVLKVRLTHFTHFDLPFAVHHIAHHHGG